jgi:hypothetical protein
MGGGYTMKQDEYEEFTDELELEISENPGGDPGYNKDEIKPFTESLKALEIGEKAELGVWTITCGEMTNEEYDKLPEFEGW